MNALSDWLELKIWRDDKVHLARFENGETVKHLEIIGDASGETGTEVKFMASKNTFSNRNYVFKTLENRLRELAFLNSGVKIILKDERPVEHLESIMIYEGGVKEFVRFLDRSKTPLIPDPIYIIGDRDDIGVEVAMWWNDSYHESVLPFTNNIPQRDGGTHMAGFRGAEVIMSDGVLEFLAHRISTNVRVLEGALTRLFAFASLVGREVNLEMVQECLADILRASDRKVTIDEIKRSTDLNNSLKLNISLNLKACTNLYINCSADR